MKLNKNQKTIEKLDTISYTDELFGIKKRVTIPHFSQKMILFQKSIKIMYLMRQRPCQLLWDLNNKRVRSGIARYRKIIPHRANCEKTKQVLLTPI